MGEKIGTDASDTARWKWGPCSLVAVIGALGLVPAGVALLIARAELAVEKDRTAQLQQATEPRLRVTYLLLPEPQVLSAQRGSTDPATRRRSEEMADAIGDFAIVLPGFENSPLEIDPTDPDRLRSANCSSAQCRSIRSGEKEALGRFLYLLIQNDGSTVAGELQLEFGFGMADQVETTEYASALGRRSGSADEVERLGDLVPGAGLLVPIASIAVVKTEDYPWGLVAFSPTVLARAISFRTPEGHGREVSVRPPADGTVLMLASEPLQIGG